MCDTRINFTKSVDNTNCVVYNKITTNTNCEVAKGGLTLNKKKIAKKLIKLRGNKSRLEVSEALGISISALQMYENAQRVPKDEIKVRIANVYGESVQSIFFDTCLHKSCGKTKTAYRGDTVTHP